LYERSGDSGETPFVAILGIILFLLPIVAVSLGVSFAAYYLATEGPGQPAMLSAWLLKRFAPPSSRSVTARSSRLSH
jgi:hypothetical protein